MNRRIDKNKPCGHLKPTQGKKKINRKPTSGGPILDGGGTLDRRGGSR